MRQAEMDKWATLARCHLRDEYTAFVSLDSPAWLAGYRDGYSKRRNNWLEWRYGPEQSSDTRYLNGYDAGAEDRRLDDQEE